MANTFKFGNGNWASKKEAVLAYNDENSNFKPLPFTFDRASSATVVNKQGLIETVGIDEPRIDFLNNTKGHLLLEPSRSNLFSYSEDIPQIFAETSITDTFEYGIAPNGIQKSTRLQLTTLGTSRYADTITSIVTSGTTYTFSCYYKGIKDETAYIKVLVVDGTSVDKQIVFTGEWQREQVTFTAGSSTNLAYIVDTREGGNASDFEVWGAQLEAGSYATSYIPTQGETNGVTRSADDIALTLPDNASFNSSVGFSVVSKFDIGAAGTGTSAPFIQFSDDTPDTYIGFGSNSSNLRCRLNLSGTAYLNTQNAPRTQRNSLFVSCDANGWSQGANGVTNHTGNNDASVFNKMTSISYGASEVYGIIKISELLIYNTRLSDSELQALTS